MKKFFLFAVAVLAVVLSACTAGAKEEVYDTKTPLFPAYSTTTELYGFINAKGNWVIAPQFASATNYFSSGLALIEQGNGRMAFIDKKGHVKEASSFDKAEPFNYGYALATFNGGYGLLDSHLNWVIEPVYSDLYISPDHIATVSVGKKMGFLDMNGKFLESDGEPIFYAAADAFVDGVCVVSSNPSRTDEKGNLRVPTYFAINKKGKAVIEDGQFLELMSLGEGCLSAMNAPSRTQFEKGDYDEEYHLIDLKGNVISSQNYAYIDRFCDGLAMVENKDGKTGYINPKGEAVIGCLYEGHCTNFVSGYAIVSNGSDKQMLINTKNEVAMTIDTEKDQFVTNAHNGLILVAHFNDNKGDSYYTYSWINIKSGNTVFSWDVKKGGSNIANYAPARN